MNQQPQTGYSAPLFVDDRPRWTDERLLGGSLDKISTKYHDKNTTLKILNGLCSDPFFRAEKVNSPEYSSIPDCAAPVTATPKNPRQVVKHSTPDFRKPLDSSYKKRTYVIGKEPPRPATARPLDRQTLRQRSGQTLQPRSSQSLPQRQFRSRGRRR